MTVRVPTTRIAAPTRRRLGREERRAAIVTAAASAFASAGFSETSMAEITASAGVSHLIIYRHFESKAALYESVLERALERFELAMSTPAAVGTHGPTAEAFLAAGRADRDAFAVLWRHAAREPAFSAWTARAHDRLLRATETALAPHVAPTLRTWAARATVAYLVEAVLVWVEDGDPRYDVRFLAATNAAQKAGIRSWARSE